MEVRARITRYRRKEKAGPKTINDEVQLLLRLCGEQGALIPGEFALCTRKSCVCNARRLQAVRLLAEGL